MVLNCIQSAAKVIALITHVLHYGSNPVILPIRLFFVKRNNLLLFPNFAGPTRDETSFTTLDELKQEHQNRHHPSTVKKKKKSV